MDERHAAWLGELAGGLHREAQLGDDTAADVAGLLDRIASGSDPIAIALLEGIVAAQRDPGAKRVMLAGAHSLFDASENASEARTEAVAAVRLHVSWPGDPRPGGARALSEEESALREEGETLFAGSCAGCHGLSLINI